MVTTVRDRIIQTAHELFYRVGFHSVGLDAILSEVGVTKTTFYNHFESKEDLVCDVLDWHDRWWQDTFRDMLDELLKNDDFNGCFFVNVAVQFPQPHDPAHEAAAAHKRAMEGIIRELAGYAGAMNAAAFAEELSLVLEGAYVTRQVTQKPDTAEIARRLVNLLVNQRIPSKS